MLLAHAFGQYSAEELAGVNQLKNPGFEIEGPYVNQDTAEIYYNPTEDDVNGDGQWNGPQLVTQSIFRDGDYWLTPEMYVSSSLPMFTNAMGAYYEIEGLYPQMTTEPFEYFNFYSHAIDYQSIASSFSFYISIGFTFWQLC